MGLELCLVASCLSRRSLSQEELTLGPDRGCRLLSSVLKRDWTLKGLSVLRGLLCNDVIQGLGMAHEQTEQSRGRTGVSEGL